MQIGGGGKKIKRKNQAEITGAVASLSCWRSNFLCGPLSADSAPAADSALPLYIQAVMLMSMATLLPYTTVSDTVCP